MATASSGTVLPEQKIVIDYKDNDRDDCLHFLTYVDTACANIDEIISRSAKVIFTSLFNAWYLKSSFEINEKKTIIHGFDVNKSFRIKYKDQTFIFAFVESMYSAGSVMLVLHGTFGCYIFTGKFCSYPAILKSPVLRPIMERKAVSRFYMDATYYERPSCFDDCSNIATSVANIIRDIPNKKIIIYADKYLTDPLLCLIAQQIEVKIYVEFIRMEALRYLGYGAYFTRNIESTRVLVSKSLRNDLENTNDAELIYIFRYSEPCDTFSSHHQQNNIHCFYFYAHSSHKECCRLLSCLKPESVHYLYSGLDRSKIVYNSDLTSKLGSKHWNICGNNVEKISSGNNNEAEVCPPQKLIENTGDSLLKRKRKVNSVPKKKKKRKLLIERSTGNMELQLDNPASAVDKNQIGPNTLNQLEKIDTPCPAFDKNQKSPNALNQLKKIDKSPANDKNQIGPNTLNQLEKIDNPCPAFDKNQKSPNALNQLKKIDKSPANDKNQINSNKKLKTICSPSPVFVENRISPNTKAHMNEVEETTLSKKNDVEPVLEELQNVEQFNTTPSTTGNTSLPIITVKKFAQINRTMEECENGLSVTNTVCISETSRPRNGEITPPKVVNSPFVRTIHIGGNNEISFEIEDTVNRGKPDSRRAEKEPIVVIESSKKSPGQSPQARQIRSPVPSPQARQIRSPVPSPQARQIRSPVPSPQARQIRIIRRPKPNSLLYYGQPTSTSRLLPTITPSKEKTTVISSNWKNISGSSILKNMSVLKDHTYFSNTTSAITKTSPTKFIMVDKPARDIISVDGKSRRDIMKQVSSDISVPDDASICSLSGRRDAPSLLKSGLTLGNILTKSSLPEGNDIRNNSPVNNEVIDSERSIVNRNDNGECLRDNSLHCEQNESPNNKNITLKDYFENTITFLDLKNANNSQTNVKGQMPRGTKKKKSSDLVLRRIENEKAVLDVDFSKTEDFGNSSVSKKNSELSVELVLREKQNTPSVHLNIPGVVGGPSKNRTYSINRKPSPEIIVLDSINSHDFANSNVDIGKNTELTTENGIKRSPHFSLVKNYPEENCIDSPKSPFTFVTSLSRQNETNVMKCESDEKNFQELEQIKKCSVSLERFPTDCINNYFYSETHGCYFRKFRGFKTSQINRGMYTRKIMDINSFFHKKKL